MVGPTYAKPKPSIDTTNQITETDVNVPTLNRGKFTRRGFLGVGSAALAMAGIVPAMAADQSRSDPGANSRCLLPIIPPSGATARVRPHDQRCETACVVDRAEMREACFSNSPSDRSLSFRQYPLSAS